MNPAGPRLALTAPSRLHFGLLSWGPRARQREFGGLGLAIRHPGLRLVVEPSERWQADGPLADRIVAASRAVGDHYARQGRAIPPLRFRVDHAPFQHVGLGSGTQLALAAGRLAQCQLGEPDLFWLDVLARVTQRGRRSGVGLHAFERGGLIVDGGGRMGRLPPLVARLPFPAHWQVVVLIPDSPTAGLHGAEEGEAFRALPPPSETLTDRLARLVLLELLPAVAEADLDGFGDALEEIQRRVGEAFAPAQGGSFCDSANRAMELLRDHGLRGVGQSSWGPAVYGFAEPEDEIADGAVAEARRDLVLPPERAFRTTAANRGALVEIVAPNEGSPE